MADAIVDGLKRTARHHVLHARLTARSLALPRYEGMQRTPRRVANFYLARLEHRAGRTRLRARPTVLHFEANNTCNLRCPGCFTGLRVPGRARAYASLDLYQRLLDELGDALLYIEPYKWGEPLLHPDVYEMVRMASDRGIGTVLSSNFSVNFDDEDAERMVRSRLPVLGVAIDAVTQPTYAVYRRGGDVGLVLDNVRRLTAAKRRLNSPTPRIALEYHVFPHNAHEIDMARGLAEDLGVGIAFSRGWVIGEDPKETDAIPPMRCFYLWQRATVNADGGVGACCGSYYASDDFGSLVPPPRAQGHVISAQELRAARFMDVWNNDRFRRARALFTSHPAARAGDETLICHRCPVLLTYQDFRASRARGEDYTSPYRNADGYAYMISRGEALGAHGPVRVWGPGDLVAAEQPARTAAPGRS